MHRGLVGQAALAAGEQRDIGAGAAHVEGDQIAEPGEFSHSLRGHHAGGWPGQHGAHRQAGGLLEADDAAVGLRQVRGGAYAQAAQTALQAADIGLHDRPEIGVHHGGRHPLILAELRRDLVRDAGEGFGKRLLQDSGGRLLMRGAHEAVEETHRHGPHAGVAQAADGGAEGIQVQRDLHRAVMAEAFRDFQAQVAGHQRGRFVDLQVIQVGALLATDFKQVAEAVRGDQAGLDAAVLDQGVGGHRGAVAEIPDLVRRAADKGDTFLHALGDAARGIVWRGGNLPDVHPAGGIVEQADIGKGSARVDADPPGHAVVSDGRRTA